MDDSGKYIHIIRTSEALPTIALAWLRLRTSKTTSEFQTAFENFFSRALNDMSHIHLPPELLRHIFESLQFDTVALSRLCCTSHVFRAIAEPLLYEDMTIKGKGGVIRLINTLLVRPQLGDFVRALNLDWSLSTNETDEAYDSWHRFYRAGPFDWRDYELELDQQGFFWTSGRPPNTDPLTAAEARRMCPGAQYAIRRHEAAPQVVLLLDMLPNLRALVARPSWIDFWFWAAFPSPKSGRGSRKRLPAGLRSLESLEVHYCRAVDDTDAASLAKSRGGYAHIEVACALLLPRLRRLVFTGQEGDANEWEMYYTEDDSDGGEPIHLERWAGRSTVTHLELRNAPMPLDVLGNLFRMMAAPEAFRYEQPGNIDCGWLNGVLDIDSLQSLTLVEYNDVSQDQSDDEDDEDDEDDLSARLPFDDFSMLDNLTHVTLPIHAIVTAEWELSTALPLSIKELDISFDTVEQARAHVPTLVDLVARHGRHALRRLVVRPVLSDAFGDQLLHACLLGNVQYYTDGPIQRQENLVAGVDSEEDWSKLWARDLGEQNTSDEDLSESSPYDSDESEDGETRSSEE